VEGCLIEASIMFLYWFSGIIKVLTRHPFQLLFTLNLINSLLIPVEM
jgi:hypothetical protein